MKIKGKSYRTIWPAVAAGILAATLSPAMASAKDSKTTFEFRLIVGCTNGSTSNLLMMLEVTHEQLCVSRDVVADGSNIKSVMLKKVHTDIDSITIVLDASGAARMLSLTETHIGGRVGVLLNGELISAPYIRDAISNEVSLILNQQGKKLEEIATAIKSSRPVP